jgi:hypothetical protein
MRASARKDGWSDLSAVAQRAKAEAIPIMVRTTAMGFAKRSTHRSETAIARLRLANKPSGSRSGYASRMRLEEKFSCGINVIWVVQSPSAKIYCFALTPNHFYIPRRPVPQRGARAIVTNAGRDAMDADSAVRRPALEVDGEVVWSWHPDAGVKLADLSPSATVAKKPGHRGERGISRKPLRAGAPGDSG